MTSNVLHFDSIDSSYVSDPFVARFPLAQKLTDVRTISLKSLEMPVSFYNIRSGSTMNQIILTTNLGNTYTVSIAVGNYTTVASLLTAVNNAFVGVVPSTTITFAASGNRCSVTATSSTITSFSLVDTILSKYVLGFRSVAFSGLSATGTVDCVLNIDNYICMYLANVSAESTSSSGRHNISFKIPLNATNGIIYFAAENASMKQSIRLMGSSQVITEIRVMMYDRFNNLILNNNADYSFSLEIN